MEFFWYLNNFALRGFWLDVLGVFLAVYLIYFLLGLALVWTLRRVFERWRVFLYALIAGGGAGLIGFLVKKFWYHPRPFVFNSVNLLLPHAGTSSFPSLHASFCFGLSTVFFIYNKKIGSLFFLLSFFVALGRVFVGVHWSADVIAGAGLGILIGYLVGLASRLLLKESLLNFKIK